MPYTKKHLKKLMEADLQFFLPIKDVRNEMRGLVYMLVVGVSMGLPEEMKRPALFHAQPSKYADASPFRSFRDPLAVVSNGIVSFAVSKNSISISSTRFRQFFSTHSRWHFD